MWTIPFGFLFCGMDFAVHAQFSQTLLAKDEVYRLLNVVPSACSFIQFQQAANIATHPAIYLITFLTSRPASKAIIPPLALQALLCAICIATGVGLIHVTSAEGYLKVMRQAPGLGVIWVWTVVTMDLGWALAGLLGVAAISKFGGQKIEWPWG